MKFRHVLSLFALCLVLGPAAHADDRPDGTGGNQALTQLFQPLGGEAPAGNAGMFVGINKFEDSGLDPLSYATHDAIETAYLFVFELKLIPARNCYLMLSGEPAADPSAAGVRNHRDELQRAGAKILSARKPEILDTFLKVSRVADSAERLLVCSFSSHGFEKNGKVYVMTSDGRIGLLEETTVPLETIETNMANSQAGHRLLLVDACQQRVSAKSLVGAGNPTSEEFIRAFKVETGQAKLASCSSGELSFEHPSLGGCGHGVFTHAILEALRGGARSDDNQVVRLGEVADYVETTVKEWTQETRGRQQSPFFAGRTATLRMPLAAKADDLATLIAFVERQPTGGGFTEQLRQELADYLRKLDTGDEADRRLVAATRNFTLRKLDVEFFVPFLDKDRQRWGGATPELLIAPFTREQAANAQQAWARSLKRKSVETNSIGMKLTLIPAGEFQMGSDDTREMLQSAGFVLNDSFDPTDEHPPHHVRITRPFYLGVYEVTKGQFAEFVRDRKYTTEAEEDGNGGGYDSATTFAEQRPEFTWKATGFTQTDSHPVVNVTWNDAVAFCEWLSRKEGRTYRLPTEAEWEYACRAGTQTCFFTGDGIESLQGFGNMQDTSFNTKFPKLDYGKYPSFPFDDRWTFIAPVGRFQSNAFGLHDMHGNAWEWCADWYGNDYYASSPVSDSIGPSSGSERVFRGGGWSGAAGRGRSADRGGLDPSLRNYNLGFRLSLSPSGKPESEPASRARSEGR